MLSVILACDVREMLNANLRLNYPEAWLESRPAFDGNEGSNSDAVIRFLVKAISGRRAVPPMTWIKQILALVLYRASSPPVAGARPRTLVIAGDEDSLVTPETAHKTAAVLGAKFVLLTGAGHNSMIQAAERVNAELESHITGTVTGRGAGSSSPAVACPGPSAIGNCSSSSSLSSTQHAEPFVQPAAVAARPMGSELW